MSLGSEYGCTYTESEGGEGTCHDEPEQRAARDDLGEYVVGVGRLRPDVLVERVFVCFFFQAEDGIRDTSVTGVQTCALPIYVDRKVGVADRCRGGAYDDFAGPGDGFRAVDEVELPRRMKHRRPHPVSAHLASLMRRCTGFNGRREWSSPASDPPR